MGDTVDAAVDVERRLDIARNHTATHLLHRALRQVLGEHAAQAGSLVSPERLRFDFTHLSALTAEELDQVAAIVNRAVRDDRPVSTRVTAYDEAVKAGAIALFGEKYGDQVRVVSVEGFSTELCGGTHLQRSGQIGAFVILGETSVGSGLRRIEALTGRGAEAYLRERLHLLQEIGGALTAPSRRGAGAHRRHARGSSANSVAPSPTCSGNWPPATWNRSWIRPWMWPAPPCWPPRPMWRMWTPCVSWWIASAIAWAVPWWPWAPSSASGPSWWWGLTPDMVKSGLSAGRLAGDAARKMGGGGGGRPDMAQAGGKDAVRLDEALATVVELVRQQRA